MKKEELIKELGGYQGAQIPLPELKIKYPDEDTPNAMMVLGQEPLSYPFQFMPFGTPFIQYVKFVDEKPLKSNFFHIKEIRAQKERYKDYQFNQFQLMYVLPLKQVAFMRLHGATLKTFIDLKVSNFNLYEVKGLQRNKKGAITYYTPIVEFKEKEFVFSLNDDVVAQLKRSLEAWEKYIKEYNGVFDAIGDEDSIYPETF